MRRATSRRPNDSLRLATLRRWALPCLLAAAVAPACADSVGGAERSRDVKLESDEFHARFASADSFELQQPDSAPIVRLSAFAVAPDGRIAVGDVSEGNVKLYGERGQLLRVLGRKGGGPGEFREPRFLQFGNDGRLHVADGTLNRIAIFDAAGGYDTTRTIAGMTFLTSFAVLPNGEYVVTSPTAADDVLFHLDSLGTVKARYLRIANVRPAGEAAIPEWRNVRQFGVAVRGDTAYVICTLSDSVWQVGLARGDVRSDRLIIPGYVKPTAPKEPLKDVRDLRRWSHSFHVAVSTKAATGGPVVVNVVQGILNYGDPNTLVVHTGSGEWFAVANAPPVLAVSDGHVYTLDSASDSATARVLIGRYRFAR